ncbi:GGDEF domain-containing protein [Actinotalea sp. AC32]|nr:GGDEF domain-containing protein [Actinotalea sp. AC32]
MRPRASTAPGPGPAEVRLLGRVLLIVGAVSLTTALFPFSPTAPVEVAATAGSAAALLGAWLLRRPDRTPAWVVHVILLVATAAMGVCVAVSTTPAGIAVTAVSFVWVALYTASVHGLQAVVGHLVVVAVALALGLLVAGAQSPAQTWFFLMATTTGVAVVLNDKTRRLRAEATVDPLTGVLSRRAFGEVAAMVTATAARTGEPLVLALLDLDDFKRVNDEGGHAAGDDVLVRLTSGWRSTLRRGDALGRLGGDEFAVLLRNTTADQAEVLLERLRRDDEPCGWSSGIAQWDRDPYDAWVARADSALYASKVMR